MDQRPGQNVDLGLYFHMEGPVSPKIMQKNRCLAEKIRKIPKKYLRVPLSVCLPYSGPLEGCLLYTSPSPRDRTRSRMPSSA